MVPPLIEDAVNVTAVPAQTGFDEDAIEMDTGRTGDIVMAEVEDTAEQPPDAAMVLVTV